MLREKLCRTFRFFITILKICVVFMFMGPNERRKTMGFKISILSIFTYMTYDYLCKLFTRKEAEQEETYKRTGYGKDYSETTKNFVDNKEKILPFKIHVPSEILADLNCRLQRTRFEEPLKDAAFRNEINSSYLRTFTGYWRTEYNWRKCEQELNNNPNFKTSVEGLDIHFLHTKATISTRENLQVIPILLIHGWPGLCYDYRKVIPLLSNSLPGGKQVFDVVCPSTPGFGFSESPQRKGFTARTAARVFVILMDRLGYPRFYVQGCGWGCVIASIMARYYPNKIMGLHVNMCFSLMATFDCTVKLFLMRFLPFLTSAAEYKMMFPFKKKLRTLFEESGLFHAQSTIPDIIGCAMSDSPTGMLACILDKYSLVTNNEWTYLLDGGLTKNRVDELLTTATIMWVNNNFAASSRFCKENVAEMWRREHEKVPLIVPSAVAAFPNEPLMMPKLVMSELFADLVSYNMMPRGGRFCAAEEPQLLAEDIRKFVEIVEKRPF